MDFDGAAGGGDYALTLEHAASSAGPGIRFDTVSAAAPVVTGIIALLLEVDPRLDGVSVKRILERTARADAFTGNTPNALWGYGKVDAFQALVAASPDDDGDGLPTRYEADRGLDPNDPANAGEDPDQDGLTNLQEFFALTDPFRDDTDQDGVSDGEEVAEGFDPVDSASCPPWICGRSRVLRLLTSGALGPDDARESAPGNAADAK